MIITALFSTTVCINISASENKFIKTHITIDKKSHTIRTLVKTSNESEMQQRPIGLRATKTTKWQQICYGICFYADIRVHELREGKECERVAERERERKNDAQKQQGVMASAVKENGIITCTINANINFIY